MGNLFTAEGSTGGAGFAGVPEVYKVEFLAGVAWAGSPGSGPTAVVCPSAGPLGLVLRIVCGSLASSHQTLLTKLLSYIVSIKLLYMELKAPKDTSAE